MADVILAEVTRGWRAKGRREVECRHRGSVVVTDAEGRTVASVGDGPAIFLRSSAKPFQALAPVLAGAVDHFGFGDREIALFCASHSAERVHVELAQSILLRLGLDVSDLECGVHAPLSRETLRAVYHSGRLPVALHNNCSGKHLGMLTLARFRGWPIAGYVDREHPVQQEILRILGALLGRRPSDIPYGSDGCGVPTPLVAQSEQARLFALLANPEAMPEEFRLSAQRIAEAMRAHPRLVGGTGRLTTELLAAAGEKVVAKTGAEGSIGVGLRARGLGISIKVSDGNSRALGPFLAELLAGLGMLDSERGRAFYDRYHNPPVTNARGERVGEVRASKRTVTTLLKQLGW